ncbi:membrane protein [Sphaerisporangium siamense]|uniref:DUF3105 domain-containing protein n=1 Tax=Sphaerisporangium siamense TaxID=795645 RepID=A0A7W7D3T0_9ACTN|nr:DUF3105 domain-containing protein [Sphaerisporangium siamense]MBB4699454.1 hypothetical protein [Sphaerisporangium siamense]GII86865.1 membrane protein [Sphaerisporangium siamense]
MTGSAHQTPSRKERLSHLRSRQHKTERLRRTAVVAGSAAAVGVVAATVVVLVTGERAKGALTEVRTLTIPAGKHTTATVTYPHSPPAGGDHDPRWLNCGVYPEPVRDENAVHAQEHGAVWVTYRPDLPQADVARLRALVRTQPYAILSPYQGLTSPVTASAWGRQLALRGPDDARLPAFLQKYAQSVDAPEPGAPCTGGTGDPIA